MSKLAAGEEKIISFKNLNFEQLETGEYLAVFKLPGANRSNLSLQELQFQDGIIWIGSSEARMNITLN